MPYYAQPSLSQTNTALLTGAYGQGQQYQQQAYQPQAYQQQCYQQGGQQYTQEQVQLQQLQQQQQCYAQQGQQQYAGAGYQQQQLIAQPQQQYGTGYGQRYLAPADIQAQLAGKPAFYDNIRGIYYDGARAWYYDSTGAPGARNSYSTGSVITAIEQRPNGVVIRLGNGTEGDYAVHRAHPSSVYYNTPLAL